MDYVQTIRAKIGNDMLIYVGAGVIIHRHGKVLFQRRKDNGMWTGVCGGGMELGETFDETARRELFEETGLTANTLEFMALSSGKDQFYTYPNGHQVYNVGATFVCSDFSGEVRAVDGEATEFRWLDINDMPPESEISPTDRRTLAEFVEKYLGVSKYAGQYIRGGESQDIQIRCNIREIRQ